MLADSAAKVIAAFPIRSPVLFLGTHDLTAQHIDPTLSGWAEHLVIRTTLAGFLTHRRGELGPERGAGRRHRPPTAASHHRREDRRPRHPNAAALRPPVLQVPEDVLRPAVPGAGTGPTTGSRLMDEGHDPGATVEKDRVVVVAGVGGVW
jgi:hypothetical protein